MTTSNFFAQKKWIIWVIVILIIASALGVVVYKLLSASPASAPQVSVTPLALLPTSTPVPTDTPMPSPSSTPAPASVNIEIRNGTHTAGLAQKLKDKLTAEHYTVSAIGNASTQDAKKTIVYNLNVADADAAQKIAAELSANGESTLPKGEAKSTADIVIILGADAPAMLK